jgi:hypothetical protein
MQKVTYLIFRNASLSLRLGNKLTSKWRKRDEIIRPDKECSKKKSNCAIIKVVYNISKQGLV